MRYLQKQKNQQGSPMAMAGDGGSEAGSAELTPTAGSGSPNQAEGLQRTQAMGAFGGIGAGQAQPASGDPLVEPRVQAVERGQGRPGELDDIGGADDGNEERIQPGVPDYARGA